jgi:hypothetical protein
MVPCHPFQPTPAQRVEQALAFFVHRHAARRANEAQELLQRAADKAQARRFKCEPEPPTGFGVLA